MKYFCHLMVGLFFFFAMLACRKNKEYDLRPVLNTANDNILSQRPFNYAFIMLLKATTDSGLQQSFHALIDGASVSLDPLGKTYTFDFLDGAFCQDSVTRYGSFSAVLDTIFFIKGASAQFAFLGYIEDNHQISGIFNIENTGINQKGNMEFSSLVDTAVITKDSVHDIHWKGKFFYQFDPANILLDPSTILISIEGSGSGISSMGFAFTNLITNTLKDSISCPWIQDGIISISLSEGDIRSGTIEFMGKSACNNRICYDFEGRIYHLWLNEKYLKN